MLDWRCPIGTHNNLPPYTNIYIRYNGRIGELGGLQYFRSGDMTSDEVESTEEQVQDSPIEIHYESHSVDELDSYQGEHYTENDFLLRLSLDDDGKAQLSKQSLRHFISIFSYVANKTLSIPFGEHGAKVSMTQALYAKLNDELTCINQFMRWYVEEVQAPLERMQQKLDKM